MIVRIGCVSSIVLASAFALRAGATPVEVGTLRVVHHGIDAAHPQPAAFGGPERHRRSTARAPRVSPSIVWTRSDLGRAVQAPLVDASGRLFVVSTTGAALLGADGVPLVRAPSDSIDAQGVISPMGTFVVATGRGALLEISTAGAAHARAISTEPVMGPIVGLDDGSIVLTTRTLSLVRYGSDGTRAWSLRMPSLVDDALAVVRDETIVCAATSRVLFVSLDGTIRAEHTLGAPVAIGPAVAPDGLVWVGSFVGELLAFDVDGHVRVRTSLGGRFIRASAIAIAADGSLRIAAPSGELVAFEPDGTERFRVTAGTPVSSALVVDADGTTIIATEQGQLYAYDAAGAERWHVALGGRTQAPPVLGRDGTIYIARVDGTLLALR